MILVFILLTTTFISIAFNSLPDVTIVVFDLSESTPTEIVVIMSVRVNNPSVVSMIPLGDLQMAMEYKGSFMGYLAAPNVSMYTQGKSHTPKFNILNLFKVLY